ncbi:MAG: MCE family protein [Candidatus Aminicenantes bacterium]|nr:MCE family protein [Candidatus Aminicenantes bacterium]
MKREMKIGIFMGMVLLVMAVLIIIIGDMSSLFKKRGYPLYVLFDSAAGLEKSAMVRMAGVRIGTVDGIRLHGMQAQAILRINQDVHIRKKSQATLAALGLLGEKYIEILPGDGEGFYQAGDYLEGISAVSFDQLGTLLLSIGSEIQEAGKAVKELIGEEGGQENFRNTLDNLSTFTADLKDFFARNRQELTTGIKDSSEVIAKLEDRLDDLSDSLDRLMESVRQVIDENRENVKTNLENIKELISQTEKALNLLNDSLKKINRGEGTLGKLIHEEDLHEKAESAVNNVSRLAAPVASMRFLTDFRMDYLADSGKLKGFLNLEFWWGDKGFLLAQIVQDPGEEDFDYSLQGGYRWGSVAPRAGIFESYIGVGLDIYFLEDRFRFSVDGYDFNRKPRPQFRLTTRFNATKHIYLFLGLENFTLAPDREFFFGLGLGI